MSADLWETHTHVDVMGRAFVRKSAANRFFDKVDLSGECWRWTAAISDNGYGKFWRGDRLVYAHQFAFELLVGDDIAGLDLDHLCRDRACVNPEHLEPVSRAENLRRGAGRGGILK